MQIPRGRKEHSTQSLAGHFLQQQLVSPFLSPTAQVGCGSQSVWLCWHTLALHSIDTVGGLACRGFLQMFLNARGGSTLGACCKAPTSRPTPVQTLLRSPSYQPALLTRQQQQQQQLQRRQQQRHVVASAGFSAAASQPHDSANPPAAAAAAAAAVPKKGSSSLAKRAVFGTILGLAGAVVIVTGGWLYAIVTCLVAYQASQELIGMLGAKGIAERGMKPPSPVINSVTSLLCVLLNLWVFMTGGRAASAMAVACFVLLSLQLLASNKPRFSQLSSSVFALLYCGECPGSSFCGAWRGSW
jgi:hypothetical protein